MFLPGRSQQLPKFGLESSTVTSSKSRVGDIVIGVTASLAGAALLTRNSKDFQDIPGLKLG